jgi:transposase
LAFSIYLNPIEHLWDELGRRLKKHPEHPKNKDELELFLREEWQQIPCVKYLNLIDSMP